LLLFFILKIFKIKKILTIPPKKKIIINIKNKIKENFIIFIKIKISPKKFSLGGIEIFIINMIKKYHIIILELLNILLILLIIRELKFIYIIYIKKNIIEDLIE
jgi:hypothetical protein